MRYLPLVLVMALEGCIGTSAKLNALSLGMTKAEVIAAMGTPDSVSATGNVEYLTYELASPKEIIADESNLPEYFVQLVGGRVDAYGRKGDFDTTKDPTLRIETSPTATPPPHN